jgi:hypothetical protein
MSRSQAKTIGKSKITQASTHIQQASRSRNTVFDQATLQEMASALSQSQGNECNFGIAIHTSDTAIAYAPSLSPSSDSECEPTRKPHLPPRFGADLGPAPTRSESNASSVSEGSKSTPKAQPKKATRQTRRRLKKAKGKSQQWQPSPKELEEAGRRIDRHVDRAMAKQTREAPNHFQHHPTVLVQHKRSPPKPPSSSPPPPPKAKARPKPELMTQVKSKPPSQGPGTTAHSTSQPPPGGTQHSLQHGPPTQQWQHQQQMEFTQVPEFECRPRTSRSQYVPSSTQLWEALMAKKADQARSRRSPSPLKRRKYLSWSHNGHESVDEPIGSYEGPGLWPSYHIEVDTAFEWW